MLMPNGTVKFYNTKSKFGFIRIDETGDEVYTHEKHLVDAIAENDRVEFELIDGKRGPIAIDVKALKE